METLLTADFTGDYVSSRRLVNACPEARYHVTDHPKPPPSKVLVTHGDTPLDKAQFERLDDSQIKLWLAQNLVHSASKLRSFPVGIANEEHDPVLGNTETFQRMLRKPKANRNLLLMAFRDDTNPQRADLRRLLAGRPFVTTVDYDRSTKGHALYAKAIYDHSFVLSPPGNGIDCVRTWETLYLRSVPIVKRHPAMDFARHLPILFVESWEQVLDIPFLEDEHKKLSRMPCDFSLMRLSYWIDTINSL